MPSWFIDAWAAVDGRAFASWRNPERPGDPLARSGGGVFLAAPHFEPEWTSSPSTALAATRGLFQWGFYDRQNAEIPFATLDDVREIVRRMYIAGGGGGQGPDGVVPPEPLRPSDDDVPEIPKSFENPVVEKKTAQELAKGLNEPHANKRRDAIKKATEQYLRTSPNNNVTRMVADVLFLTTRYPHQGLASVEAAREWSVSLVIWSLLLDLLTRDPDLAPNIIIKGRTVSSCRSPYYNSMVDKVIDFLKFWHGQHPCPWWLGGWPQAERQAPLTTLPRWLILPSRHRGPPTSPLFPKWTTHLGDVLCVLASSYQTTSKILNNGNVAALVGSATSMTVASLILHNDFLLFLPSFSDREWNNMQDLNSYRDVIFEETAVWLGANMAGPELQDNAPASEALEDFLWDKVGDYHSKP